MESKSHIIAVLLLGICMITGCDHMCFTPESCEIAISRCLEQAIEAGEKVLAQRELIEHVALTEGTDAAAKLHDELHYRANYEAFWKNLYEADSISRQVKDTLVRQEISSHLRPYINRLIEMECEILP